MPTTPLPRSRLTLAHWIAVALTFLLAHSLVWGQTPPGADALLVKRATELRSGPGESQASLGPLAAQTTVTRLAGRQGPWVEVRTAAGTTGWLHMFDLTSAGSASGTGNVATGALRSIGNFFNRSNAPANNSGGVTATVGIRGLSAEDLERAQPNLNAVLMLETMRQDARQTRSFAAQMQWTTQAVEALPVPPAPAAAQNTGDPTQR